MAQDLSASMDTARKLNDCYFYYYSTCTKGDNCVFRHEPSALGCETMCAAWQQGKCLDKKCKLRHMELRKNRKQIPCYWESQPCGCRKKHCPFMHRNPEARTDGIAPSQMTGPTVAGTANSVPVERGVCEPQLVGSVGVGGVVSAGRVPTASVQPTVASVPLIWQREINRSVMLDSGILGVLPSSSELMGGRPPAPSYAAVPVDSLVVNFDEESDCDSVQSTPKKALVGGGDGNEDEEMKLLERIQAESAAYYSYSGEHAKEQPNQANKSLDFKILSLDEIRARKKSIDTHTPTIKFNRKRKFSQETIIDSGNKIMKLVRSNSIVYKKVDHAPSQTVTKQEIKVSLRSRARTQSEQSEMTEQQENELLDYDSQFKKIETEIHTNKPILIINRHSDPIINIDNINDGSIESEIIDSINVSSDLNSRSELHPTIDCETIELDTADSDTEVQVIQEVYNNIEECDIFTDCDPVVVDLCDADDDIVEANSNNFPDVVTSCQSNVSEEGLVYEL